MVVQLKLILPNPQSSLTGGARASIPPTKWKLVLVEADFALAWLLRLNPISSRNQDGITKD